MTSGSPIIAADWILITVFEAGERNLSFDVRRYWFSAYPKVYWHWCSSKHFKTVGHVLVDTFLSQMTRALADKMHRQSRLYTTVYRDGKCGFTDRIIKIPFWGPRQQVPFSTCIFSVRDAIPPASLWVLRFSRSFIGHECFRYYDIAGAFPSIDFRVDCRLIQNEKTNIALILTKWVLLTKSIS